MLKDEVAVGKFPASQEQGTVEVGIVLDPDVGLENFQDSGNGDEREDREVRKPRAGPFHRVNISPPALGIGAAVH